MNLVYKLGYYFRKESINYTTLFTNRTGYSDFADRWQQPGDEQKTQVPSMIYPTINARDKFYSSSEALVEKGDHIRLQFISLGYEFIPNNKRLPFQRVQLFANISNIGILWRANHAKLDPDYPYSLPPSKTFSIGLRTDF